jgi:hypothetical protein
MMNNGDFGDLVALFSPSMRRRTVSPIGMVVMIAALGSVAAAGCRDSAGDVPMAVVTRPSASADPPTPAGAVADGGPKTSTDDRCSADEDCVPAACCHAAACVPKARRPECRGIMCTMQCQADTMDCGGGCACQAGHCTARLIHVHGEAPR